MENPHQYTVTIIKNMGVPVSFTLKRHKLLIAVFVFLILLVATSFFTVQYWLERPQINQVKQQLKEISAKNKLLNKQVSEFNQDQFFTTGAKEGESLERVKASLQYQPEFTTEGIWTSNNSTTSLEDLDEGRIVDVRKPKISLKGDMLSVSFRLRNKSIPFQAVGGYVFAVLRNKDRSPVEYRSANDKPMGENGYPISYKTGKLYHLKRKNRLMRFRTRLTGANEYYSELILFIYTYKGSLISKKVFPIDKKLFFE